MNDTPTITPTTTKTGKVYLEENEKLMIADLCNSWIYPHCGDLEEVDKAARDTQGNQSLPAVSRQPDGKIILEVNRVASRLESAILDGCNETLEGERSFEEKWGIDGVALIQKIRSMTYSERALLLVGVRVAYEQERTQTGRFEAVLKGLLI